MKPGEPESLAVALGYARSGMPVFPIAIGWDEGAHKTTKRPLVAGGFKSATVVVEHVEAMWQQAFPLHDGEVMGTGLHIGAGGVVVLDVDVGEGVHGDETLADLEEANGKLPHTARATTPSGGWHVWMAKPPGLHVSNHSPWPGIDVRADGGFVVAPGTTSPWGSWAWEFDPFDGTPVVPAPSWVIAQLREYREGQAGPWRPYVAAEHDETTAEAVKVLTETYGGHTPTTVVKEGRPIVSLLRPGKRAGKSAEVGWHGPGVVDVFTTEWPGLPRGTWDLDHLLAGSFVSTDDRMREWARNANLPPPSVTVTNEPKGSDPIGAWRIDTEGYAEWLLSSEPDVEPDVLKRDDGKALFYRGRTNMIVGRRNEGKTMLAEFMLGQSADNGLRVLYLDMESTKGQWLDRLRAMGFSIERHVMEGRAWWYKPPLMIPVTNMPTLVDYLAQWDVVVFDVLNRLITRMNGDPDTGNRHVMWLTDNLFDPLADKGVCVVLLDHPNKRGQRRSADVEDMEPGGGAFKLNNLSGAAIAIRAITKFSRTGSGGRIHLFSLKDRGGHWEEGQHVATFTGEQGVVMRDGLEGIGFRVALTEPVAESERDHRAVMTMAILGVLDHNREEYPDGDGLTANELRTAAVKGTGAAGLWPYFGPTLRALVTEGSVRATKISRTTYYRSVLPGDVAETGTEDDGPEQGFNPV